MLLLLKPEFADAMNDSHAVVSSVLSSTPVGRRTGTGSSVVAAPRLDQLR
jgi:hypothetical protein